MAILTYLAFNSGNTCNKHVMYDASTFYSKHNIRWNKIYAFTDIPQEHLYTLHRNLDDFHNTESPALELLESILYLSLN